MNIGVIAEEANDVEVLYQLTCKLLDEASFSFKKFVGHGCGKLRKKCSAWASDLHMRGCTHLIVVHDLDDADMSVLRRKLSKSVEHTAFRASLILIPVREMEAWLLTDPLAIALAFNLRKEPKVPTKPENVLDPKKRLGEIVWASGKKQYVNSIHNAKIAKELRIERAKACPSFCPFVEFIRSI